MTEIALIKMHNGFMPADPQSEDFAKKIKIGAVIHSDFKRLRNYKFHKKLFSLLNLGFEYWEPPDLTTKWGKPEKNFERFRKDVTILAGYYHNVFRLDGTFRIEADSISFGNMEQCVFDKLYQDVLTVLLKKIPMMAKIGPDEIDKLTDKFLEYA